MGRVFGLLYRIGRYLNARVQLAIEDGDRRYSCERKVGYPGQATAERAVEAMTAKGVLGLEPYCCRYCCGWHIGHGNEED